TPPSAEACRPIWLVRRDKLIGCAERTNHLEKHVRGALPRKTCCAESRKWLSDAIQPLETSAERAKTRKTRGSDAANRDSTPRIRISDSRKRAFRRNSARSRFAKTGERNWHGGEPRRCLGLYRPG